MMISSGTQLRAATPSVLRTAQVPAHVPTTGAAVRKSRGTCRATAYFYGKAKLGVHARSAPAALPPVLVKVKP